MNFIEEFITRHVRTASLSMERKQIATPPRSVNEQDRTIDFVASTETPDRRGDILRVKGWQLKNFEKNPVFLFAHRSTEPPIGTVAKSWTENNPPALIQRVRFASKDAYPFAESVRRLYAEQIMRGISVGFQPLEEPAPIFDDTGRMTGYEYRSMELLETSAVPIPCQPEALARAITKGFVSERDTEKLFERSESPIQIATVEQLFSFLS